MATKESSQQDIQIELLKEDNFSTWFVDIRAKLRSKKLWTYTQSPYVSTEETTTAVDTATGDQTSTPVVSKKEQKAIKDWEDKSQEAADLMTPTISRVVKRKLTELEFNDGYLMLSRLQVLLQPSGSSEFMRLSKEYYSLQYNVFKSMSDYLTQCGQPYDSLSFDVTASGISVSRTNLGSHALNHGRQSTYHGPRGQPAT